MSHKFGNAAAMARFNSGVTRWLGLALLLLLAFSLMPAMAAHPMPALLCVGAVVPSLPRAYVAGARTFFSGAMKSSGGHSKTTSRRAVSPHLAGREILPPERERKRAAVLHAAMLRIAELWPEASKAQRYRRMKQRVKRANFSMTQRNFRRLCTAWDADKRPESLIRKCRPGRPRASAEGIVTVVRFAITNRTSLTESVRILRAMDRTIPTVRSVKAANPPAKAIRRLWELNRQRLQIDLEISRAHDDATAWLSRNDRTREEALKP